MRYKSSRCDRVVGFICTIPVQEAEQRSSKKFGCEAVRLYTGTTAQVSRGLVTRQE